MATTLQMLPNRNRVINGNFRTNQRAYASAGALASGAYGFDRWKSTTASSSLTFTAAPQGQPVTLSSGGSIAQVVERANVEADTYVLSWSGTATGRVYNVGGSAPAYAASPITVTVDGLADLTVEFTATGGTKTLGKVQLEAGTQPTPFEVIPVGAELALCQRYYWRYAGNATGNAVAAIGQATSTVAFFVWLQFPVTMRAVPTLVSAGSWQIRIGGAAYALTSGPTLTTAESTGSADMTGGIAAGLAANIAVALQQAAAGAALSFTAEL